MKLTYENITEHFYSQYQKCKSEFDRALFFEHDHKLIQFLYEFEVIDRNLHDSLDSYLLNLYLS